MKKLFSAGLLIGLAAAFTTTAVFAAEPDNYVMRTKSSYFIGGLAGYSVINTFDNNPNPNSPFSHTSGDFSWGANAGYNYAINPYFTIGIQGDYLVFGQTKYSGTDNLGNALPNNNFYIKSTGWDGLLVATYYAGNSGLNISAKGGLAYVNQIFNGQASMPVGNNTQYMPEVGASIGYLWKTLNFSAEYRHIFGQNQNDINQTFMLSSQPAGQFNNNASIDAFFFAVTYYFSFDPSP